MGETKRFRDQHDEILKVASEILEHLNVDELSDDISEVRDLLSKLHGKLNVHLSMEDNSFYPQLIEHSDENIKSMARKYFPICTLHFPIESLPIFYSHKKTKKRTPFVKNSVLFCSIKFFSLTYRPWASLESAF